MELSNQGIYVCNGDLLILSLTTSDATGSVIIRGRVLYRDHEIMPFERVLSFSGTGVQSDVVATLTEGFLLGFDVSRASGDLAEGEVVASVHVGRNAGNIQQKMMCLASGEVSNVRSLGMGGFTAAGSVSMPATLTVTSGVPSSTNIPIPAAGQPFIATVPTGEYWVNPKALTLFATSAVAGNREVTVGIVVSGVEIYRQHALAFQPASTSILYSIGPLGVAYTSSGNTAAAIPIPPCTLGPGYLLVIQALGVQAGDNWTSLQVSYDKRSI